MSPSRPRVHILLACYHFDLVQKIITEYIMRTIRHDGHDGHDGPSAWSAFTPFTPAHDGVLEASRRERQSQHRCA